MMAVMGKEHTMHVFNKGVGLDNRKHPDKGSLCRYKGGQMKTPEEIATEHWEWIEGLFESLPDDAVFGISTTEYLYKTAFIHGFKHGKLSKEEE